MLRADGYSIITSPGERPVEADLEKCAHCQAIQFMRAGFGAPQVMIFRADATHYMRDVSRCLNCYRFICPRCEGKPCIPFEKKVDLEEAAARKRIVCE